MTVVAGQTEAGHEPGWLNRWGLAMVLLAFLLTSLAAVGKPVTSMEMNRNDAACYLILADNLVHHGVYSMSRTEPYLPHTEWPPGTPLLYTVPVALASGLPTLSTAWVFHAWTLLISSLSLVALYRWAKLFVDVPIALAVTAATAFSRAFLDSGQAAVADSAAVGAAFFCLRMVHLKFAGTVEQRPNPFVFYGSLALLPLTKPYLGLVFVAWLWRVLTRMDSWRDRFRQLLMMALCCVPFAGFIVYSVVAAQAAETISAVTWLTTSNPVEVREGVDVASDSITLGARLEMARHTLQYFLVYHAVNSPLPILDWAGLRDWPLAFRGVVVVLVGLAMILGLLSTTGRILKAEFAYAAALLVFFVLFECDSARYFTVLTPLCAMCFFLGARDVLQRFRWRLPELKLVHAALAAAVVSGVCWSQRQMAADIDPDPLFADIYTALKIARDDDRIETLYVPQWLRDLSIVETHKPVTGFAGPQLDETALKGCAVLQVSREVPDEDPNWDREVAGQDRASEFCFVSRDGRVRLVLANAAASSDRLRQRRAD
jgi:hypothetical protein